MPPPYHNPHWNAFVNAGYQSQRTVGDTPAQWALGLPKVPMNLPVTEQTRQQVRALCRNKNINELFAYICAMAWGGQNNRFGHKTLAWKHRHLITPKLEALRAGKLNHSKAYNLFSGANSVPGLGSAFFTKLIYFFSPAPPNGATGFYMMDQWTAKSINLLNQKWVVRLARVANASPGAGNTSGNYEAFCCEVEHIVTALGLNGAGIGDQVEQRLMSKGGHYPHPWRAYVRANWPKNAPVGRYNPAALHGIYKHIPIECF